VFEGKKTYVFWIGLLVLAFAAVGLFGVFWMIAVWNGYTDWFRVLKQVVPVIVAGVVFILIGFYMMRSGVRKKEKV
jgi:putative Mn2+ efflux pump MntP